MDIWHIFLNFFFAADMKIFQWYAPHCFKKMKCNAMNIGIGKFRNTAKKKNKNKKRSQKIQKYYHKISSFARLKSRDFKLFSVILKS